MAIAGCTGGVDGIYSGLRGEHERLCALVVMGVNERGQKRFLAIEDGVRESAQSRREVLLKLKARGVEIPPELAVGDGALGFWVAIEEVYPRTRTQRCWKHKAANILNYLPKSVRKPRARCMRSGWLRPAVRPSSPSMTFRPSTGCTCARRIQSSRRSRPSDIALIAPRAA